MASVVPPEATSNEVLEKTDPNIPFYEKPFCKVQFASNAIAAALLPPDKKSKNPKDLKTNILYSFSSWGNYVKVTSCTVTKQRGHPDVCDLTMVSGMRSAQLVLNAVDASNKKMIVSMGWLDKPHPDFDVEATMRGVVFVGFVRTPDVKYTREGTIEYTFRSTSVLPNVMLKETILVPPGITLMQAAKIILKNYFLLYEVVITDAARKIMESVKTDKTVIKTIPYETALNYFGRLFRRYNVSYSIGYYPDGSDNYRLKMVIYSNVVKYTPTGDGDAIETFRDAQVPSMNSLKNREFPSGAMPVVVANDRLSANKRGVNLGPEKVAEQTLQITWATHPEKNSQEVEFMRQEGANSSTTIQVGEDGKIKPQTTAFDDGSGEKIYKLNVGKVEAFINAEGAAAFLQYTATAADPEIISKFYDVLSNASSRPAPNNSPNAPTGGGATWKAKVKFFRGMVRPFPGMTGKFYGLPDPSMRGTTKNRKWIVDSVVHQFGTDGFQTETELAK